MNLHFHFSCVFLKKDKFLKLDALSGRTVLEEKISVAFHKEEVVKERTELEVVETPVEYLEEEEFHEVQEYFEEEEFHEVEEFVKVEQPRIEEVHKAEEVHRVIEVLEAEEVEVYEKPKAPPKGIGEFCRYYKLLYLALTHFLFKCISCSVWNTRNPLTFQVKIIECFKHELQLFDTKFNME